MPMFVLIRHAKAEPHRSGDHTRALAARARVDAAAMGGWLHGSGLLLERAVVSSSSRTRETWQATGLACPDVVFEERVYEATSEDLRAVIAETPVDVDVLALVGHNPAVERLAWELASDVQAMPTSAAAVFSVEDWSLAGAVLQQLWTPRGGAAPSASP